MKNYKAKKTAENLQISQKDKESLVRLMIFATTLGDNIDELEASKTRALAADWQTENAKDISTPDSLRRLQESKWAEQQDLYDIIAIMVDILSDSDFFDIQNTLKKTLREYKTDFMDRVPNATSEEANKIQFTNSDFACQFYGDDGHGGKRKISDAEKYANLMYLTNQLSHTFSEAYNKDVPGISNSHIKHITYELRKIKDWCIHKLIEEKSKGEPIDIATAVDHNVQSTNKGLISFAIPNYLEPFIIHYNPSILSEEELVLCDGTERFSSQGLRTSFPQYLSDEKMKLLEKLHKHFDLSSNNGTYIRTRKLEWLFDTKKILKSLERKQIMNSPSKESNMKRTSNSRLLDVQKENIDTFESIQKNIGISFPKSFTDCFLYRTSYSIAQYMQAVSEATKEALAKKGVPENEIDKEFAKLIFYMKITKPLSSISLKPKDGKVEQALEALDEYEPVYDMIISGLQQGKSYPELRSQARKRANEIALQKHNEVKEIEHHIEENQNEEKISSKDTAPKDIETISLPTETVKSWQKKILDLTSEISTITAQIEEASKKLITLQNELSNVQAQMQEAIHDRNDTKDNKGDR